MAADRDPAFGGVEEAQQKVQHRGLAGAAGADQGDPPPGLEPQVEAAQDGLLVPVASGHALEGDGCPGGRPWARLRRVAHQGLALHGLEHAPPGGEQARKLPRRAWKRDDGVEEGEREQGERPDEDTVEGGTLPGRGTGTRSLASSWAGRAAASCRTRRLSSGRATRITTRGR